GMSVLDVNEDLSALNSIVKSGYLLHLITSLIGGTFLFVLYIYLSAEVALRLYMSGRYDEYASKWTLMKG
ncbi:hypothetical protein KIPB_014493, partial [Kipferlia bialata]